MKNVFCFFVLLFCLGGGKCFSQQVLSLFQSLDWEQASLVAARENKLVFVEVGEGDAGDTWDLSDNFDLVQALERQVIAIRVHVNSPQGRTQSKTGEQQDSPVCRFDFAGGALCSKGGA